MHPPGALFLTPTVLGQFGSFKKMPREFPERPVVRTLGFQLRVWVPSQLGELRSCQPRGMASKKKKKRRMSRVRFDVQDGDWEKQLQEEKRRWERLQAEMWVWALCRSEVSKKGQAGVGSGLSTVLGKFFVQADGNWSQGHHRRHPTSHQDGPTFISLPCWVIGWCIHGARGGFGAQGGFRAHQWAVNQSVMCPAVGDPRG